MDTKKRIVKATVIFLLFMMVFTIISRTADNLSVAKVTINNLEKQKISHDIRLQGQIATKNETIITTIGNQLIKSIHVSEGQVVEKGSVLFTIEEENLEEQIKQLEESLTNKEEKQKIKKVRAQEDYDFAVSQGDSAVSRAETEMNEAKLAYDTYATNINDEYEESKATGLYSTYKEKVTAYELALEERETKIRNAKRALEDAAVTNEDTSDDINNQENKEKLDKLQELKKQKGQILATKKGIVNKINGEIGSLTNETGTIILGDVDSELMVEAKVPVSSSQYISETTKVKMESLDGNKEKVVENLTISSMKLNPNEPGYMDISIGVPAGSYEVGTIVNINIQNESKTYDQCFPLEALRQDASNKYYVLIIKEKETVLGNELIAKKMAVDIIDKNDVYVAIDSESLAVDSEIIIETSKDIEDGSRVKRKIV